MLKNGEMWLDDDWNKTMNISRLTDDYLKTDGFFVSILVDQEREAPALFYKDNRYYMITSGCTGWDYNSALYAESPYLMGKWKLIDNPCEGEGYRDTFYNTEQQIDGKMV